MAKLAWLNRLPGGSAKEIEGKHQFTELGIFGFYWWKVELGNGKFDSFSMAFWDEDREVWWGYAADGVVCWSGPKPPSTVQLLLDMENIMTDYRHHDQATEIFYRIYQQYGFKGIMAFYDLARTPDSVVKTFNGLFEGSVSRLAVLLNLE